jgi:predicted ATPase
MARLDRLGPAKEVIQIGTLAASSRTNSYMRSIQSLTKSYKSPSTVQVAIHSATMRNYFTHEVSSRDSSYRFKHALIRDAAYQALLRSRRKALHSRIAEVVVQQFPERARSAPELVAHHYTEAGLVEQAIPYWQRSKQKRKNQF